MPATLIADYPSHSTATGPIASTRAVATALIDASSSADERAFMACLKARAGAKGKPLHRIPIFDRLPLNLFALFHAVVARGGLQSVIDRKLWRFVVSDLQVDPDRSDAGFRLRLHYGKYLLDFETACVAAEQAVSAGATDPSTVQLARFVAMTPEEHQQRVAASVASARASCSALLAETTSTTSMPSSSSDALAQSSSAAAAATPVLAPQGLMLHEVAYMSIKAASNTSVRRASADVLPAKAPVQAGTRKRATASAADSCDGDDDVFVTARPSKQMPDYVTVQKNLNNLAVGRVRPTEIVNVAAAPPTTRGSDDDSTEELATIAKFLTRLRDDFL